MQASRRYFSRRRLYTGLEKILSTFPPSIQIQTYKHFLSIHPNRKSVDIYEEDGVWILKNRSSMERFHFPSQPHLEQMRKVSVGYTERMVEKYTDSGFVDIEAGDRVFEVGGFVGAFSKYAASKASMLLVCEPFPDTRACLSENLSSYDNVIINDSLVWEEDTTRQLHLGADPSDHSTIDIDEGKRIDKIDVNARRASSICESEGLEEIDFAKIDAEGAEPEVVRSFSGIDVEKWAVDCSPERGGESTAYEVRDIISSMADYSIQSRGDMVFAKKK